MANIALIDTWIAQTADRLNYDLEELDSRETTVIEGGGSIDATTVMVGSASGWSPGSASEATAEEGVLHLTDSTIPSLTIAQINVVQSIRS